MATGSFAVSQRFVIGDQQYRVFRDLGQGMIAVEELSTGRISERSIPDLLSTWAKGELKLGNSVGVIRPGAAPLDVLGVAHEDAFRQSYSEAQQNSARIKLVYIERLQGVPRSNSLMRPVIDEVWADKKLWSQVPGFAKPPHFTTVARWIRVYEKSDRDIRSLVDRHSEKGNKSERLDPVVLEMADDLIQTRYLTEERPTLKLILKEIRGLVALRNSTRLQSEQLRAPSYDFLKRRIGDIAPYDVCRARFGKRVADLKFRVAGGGVLTLKPLARALMDHSRMDVFVVDERSGLPLGRPWLTLVLDEHTRYVLGYSISFEEPSNVSMIRALRHALGPKVLLPDVKGTWDAWGLMETLVVDNGTEFHGGALEAGAGRFGITIQFCPRRKPWFKGKIERFFGTLNSGLLVDIKGKTFSNIFLRGDYDPAKNAVITLETLKRIIQIWIVDVYHQETHRALGISPEQAWRDGISEVDRYLPPSSVAVEAAFSTAAKRRLTHKGIEFDLLFYNSAELGAIRELYGNEIEVEVRTCDDDLGSLVVVAPDGKTVIKVPAVDSEYANGLTRWQHRVCKRYQRRLQDDDAKEIGLLDARNRIRSLIEQDMQLSRRRTRNRQQRFLQSDLGGSSSSGEAPTPSSQSLTGATELTSEPSVSSGPSEAANCDDMSEFSSRKLQGHRQ